MDTIKPISISAGDYSCDILSNYGACINSFKYKHKSFINGYSNVDEIVKQQYKNVLLAPFPNRLAGAQYKFNGKRYTLPINRAKESLAIHGFLYDKTFTTIKQNTNSLELTYSYDKELRGYPFAFQLYVNYHLSENGCLKISTNVINKGEEAMPFGQGWHPYFTFQESIDNLYMTLPALQRLCVDENKIPTGKMISFTDNEQQIAVKDLILDDCFLYVADKRNKIKVESKTMRLELSMQKKSYPYVQIYTPKDRTCIAVEPMTCPPNAFNALEDCDIIKPKDSQKTAFTIQATLLN